MTIVEKLLKLDAGKIAMPTKTLKLTCKKIKMDLDFPLLAVDAERYGEIQENSFELKKGDLKKINMYAMKTQIIIEGCPEVFKSKELMGHFNAPSPRELIRKILLSGEVDDLYNAVNELSGYDKDEDDEKEIKN